MRAIPLLLLSSLAPCQDLEVPAATLRPLERVATELKKAMLRHELDTLVSVLRECGYPERSMDGLHKRLDKTRPADRPPRVSTLAGQVEKVAERMAELLPDLDEAARASLARQILRLDGDLLPAREALQHERICGLWLTPEELALRARRGAILGAVAGARALRPGVDSGPSQNPLLVALAEKRKGQEHLPQIEPSRAFCQAVTLHMLAEPGRATRILRQVLRTAALAAWMEEGELKLPQLQSKQFVLLLSRDEYLSALDAAVADGRVKEEDAKLYRRLHGYTDPRGFEVLWFYREEEAAAYLARLTLGDDDRFAPLREGILNWAAMQVLGTWMPRNLVSVFETLELGEVEIEIFFDSAGVHPRQYYEGERSDENTRLAWAGREGARRWLQHLIRFDRARPWEVSFGEHPDSLGGNRLLRATTMAEMFLEDGALKTLLEKLPRRGLERAEVRAKVEAELGNLGDLESRWRDWLGPYPASLEEQILLADAESVDAGHGQLLEELVELRAQAFHRKSDIPRIALVLDRELSLGATAHAQYLALSGTAGEPDSQDPSSPLFTARGARAAQHSLVWSEGTRPAAALQTLMARFPDRCLLLDPGLRCLGLGTAGSHLVIDCGSVVEPSFAEYRVHWPVRDQKNVPLRHGSGRSPIEGIAAESLGYPITLQVGQRQRGPTLRVRMALFRVERSGKVPVDCHLLSPEGSSDGICMPRRFCLVPVSPLEPRTTYEVQVLFPEDKEDMSWQFTTGR